MTKPFLTTFTCWTTPAPCWHIHPRALLLHPKPVRQVWLQLSVPPAVQPVMVLICLWWVPVGTPGFFWLLEQSTVFPGLPCACPGGWHNPLLLLHDHSYSKSAAAPQEADTASSQCALENASGSPAWHRVFKNMQLIDFIISLHSEGLSARVRKMLCAVYRRICEWMDETLFPEACGATLNVIINKSIILMGQSWKMCFLERSHWSSAHPTASLVWAGCAA